jgi:hypothetical protein
MFSETKAFDSIHRLIVPVESITPDLEERVIAYVFGYAKLLEEGRPVGIKDHERSAKKRLKENPRDEEAIYDRIRADMRRFHYFVRYLADKSWELVKEKIPVNRRRKADPVREYVISRLAVVWRWKTGALPKKSLSDAVAYDSPEPRDVFFNWAADLMSDNFGTRRHGLEKTLFYLYRKLPTNSFIN